MLFKAKIAMLLIFIALLINNNISLCEELCENGHLIDETNSSLDFTGICLFLGSPFFFDMGPKTSCLLVFRYVI